METLIKEATNNKNSGRESLEIATEKYLWAKTYNLFLRELYLKNEFQAEKLTFHYVPPEIFVRCHWVKSRIVVLAYRSFLMIYTVSTLACSFRGFHHPSTPHQVWVMWLCNWNYLLITIYFLLVYIFVLTNYMHETKILPMSPSSYTLNTESPDVILPSEFKHEVNTWYYKLNWACFAISLQIAPLLTVIYFYSVLPSKHLDYIPAGDAHMYVIPTVLMLVEMIMCCLPIRLLHFLYACHFFIIYIMFTLLHWLSNYYGQALYPKVIDWNQAIDSLISLFVLISILQPLIHLIEYTLYRLKCLIYLQFL